jgi:hypothetical protein
MTKDGANAAFALLSYYAKKYKERYNTTPTVNKYKEKWAASSILEDYDKQDVYDVMDFYFTLSREVHTLAWFFNNFDRLYESRLSHQADLKAREERRIQTAKLREEWLNGNA